MRARLPAATIAAALIAYAVSPYVTMYRLDRALRTGDADYINAHVDWPAVREDVVAQVDEAVSSAIGNPQDQNELPAFGSSFAHEMAHHMADAQMQRDAMMSRIREYAAMDQPATAQAPVAATAPAERAVQWACFDSLTSFDIKLAVGQAVSSEPVQLQMRLISGTWTVTGASVPVDLLKQAPSRT